MMDRDRAREILALCGIPVGEDCDRLPSWQIEMLLQEADFVKYRKPKNANGSRARYFHEYLQRRAAKKEG